MKRKIVDANGDEVKMTLELAEMLLAILDPARADIDTLNWLKDFVRNDTSFEPD